LEETSISTVVGHAATMLGGRSASYTTPSGVKAERCMDKLIKNPTPPHVPKLGKPVFYKGIMGYYKFLDN